MNLTLTRRGLFGLAGGCFAAATLPATAGYADALREGLARDGVANDFPKFRSLVERGSRSVYLPGGAKPYRFDLTGERPVTVPAGMEIWGDARTTIELVTTAPGASAFATLHADNIRLHDLNIIGNFAQGSRGWIFSIAGERGRVENVRLDLGNQEMASGESLHIVHGIFPSPDHPTSGWQFDGLVIDRAQRAFFRANSDRAVLTDLTFKSCVFKRSFTELIALNSPVSAVLNASFTDCRFEGNPLASKPSLLLGMTGSQQSVVRGCFFSGECTDAVHIEQNTRDLLIANCHFEVQGNGVTMLADNMGGILQSPVGIVIRDNHILGLPPPHDRARGRGIWCVWNASGSPGAESVSVESNEISGFEIGIDLGDVPVSGVIARDNVIQDCATAIRALSPSLGVSDNTMRNCDVGLVNRRPGSWGRQSHPECRMPSRQEGGG